MTQLTYPAFSSLRRGLLDEGKQAIELARMTDGERKVKAAELETEVPEGATFVHMEIPPGVCDRSKHYGNVRYIVAYDAYCDRFLGRLDVTFELSPKP